MKEFYMQTESGNNLHYCIWYPKNAPIAVLQIIHGVAEYVERYHDFAEYLSENGYLVVGADHPGHGKSVNETGQLGYLTGGWMETVKAIHQLYEKIQADHEGLPYYMLGHSMGSFLLRTYLFTYHTPLSGAILSGTGWQPAAILPAALAICKLEAKRLGESAHSSLLQKLMFGAYNQKFAPNRTPYDWISSDTNVVDQYVSDPLCGFPLSIQLSTQMLMGIQMIQKNDNIARMKKDIPVYFMFGEMDPVGEMGKGVLRTANSFRNAGMNNVTVKLYPQMRHELLNEVIKARVYQDVLSWLKQ